MSYLLIYTGPESGTKDHFMQLCIRLEILSNRGFRAIKKQRIYDALASDVWTYGLSEVGRFIDKVR
jgi:hypothetical protein